MRVISLNCNGIRAAARKGFFDWLPRQDADVVCLQEIKAMEDQLDETFYPQEFHCYYHSAEKKGYSGVGLYARTRPDEVIVGLGWDEFDAEGRCIEARFGNLSVISLYMPSGSSADARQQVKYRVMDRFFEQMREWGASGRDYIICGDWNIAHRRIDIRNWRGNQKNSGFLPEERAWMDRVFDELGWVDSFRFLYPEREQYTWWSNRGQAWTNNTGWRIDYQIVTPGLAETLQRSAVYTDERFSDHAPLTVDYDHP
ncbi:exodeoxyribonuclease III [Methylonatrum kenyense]|uniref:exodeoxyribonuclease III n=1 Tax=Methylonatrum kenyense TaxID=455253 RepID=UPI0020BDB5A2|nr:exodeoxyribonuclease III [Methylonatrum kenyense]MCK8516714.1 exodeoxyribonuclease III [Methylonatrum kenyense]